MGDVAGKTVLVTGASRGIGAATAVLSMLGAAITSFRRRRATSTASPMPNRRIGRIVQLQ